LAADSNIVGVPDQRAVADLTPEIGRGAARYAEPKMVKKSERGDR
jgi:hypothetical protein